MLPAGPSCPAAAAKKQPLWGRGCPGLCVFFCGQIPPKPAFWPPDVLIIAQARHNKKAGAAFLAFFLVFGAGEGPLFPPPRPKCSTWNNLAAEGLLQGKYQIFFKVWPPRGCYTLLIGRGVAPAKKEAPPMTFPRKGHPDPSGGRCSAAAPQAARSGQNAAPPPADRAAPFQGIFDLPVLYSFYRPAPRQKGDLHPWIRPAQTVRPFPSNDRPRTAARRAGMGDPAAASGGTHHSRRSAGLPAPLSCRCWC